MGITKDSLQKTVYKLMQITKDILTVSAQKSKVMAFESPDPIRTKIPNNSEILETSHSFKIFRKYVSYTNGIIIIYKLKNFIKKIWHYKQYFFAKIP